MATRPGTLVDRQWLIVDSGTSHGGLPVNHQLKTISQFPNFSAKGRMRPACRSVFGRVRLCLHFRFAEDEGVFVFRFVLVLVLVLDCPVG